jgi:hypothetical protein
MRSAGTITPEVDHLVAVAAEDDADDVLADVARRPSLVPSTIRAADERSVFSASMKGSRYATARFMRARSSRPAEGTSSRPEQVADDLHPVHERAFDHVERSVARA